MCMSKEVSFIILQASVVFNQQLSLFDNNYEDTKQGRNAAFKEVINRLIKKGIVKISPRITEYIMVYKTKINDEILYCQLAKKTEMDTYRLKGKTITQENIESYPPLDVFINVERQQFAIELNSKILSVSSCITTITNLINSLVKEYSIFFTAIQDKKEFWENISEDDDIKEISFDLVVPNFFGATGAARDLVDGAKTSLNADGIELSIKNKKGKLKANIESIDSFVKYSSTCGSWKLRIKCPGESKYRIINSTDCCKKNQIDVEILDLLKKTDSNWHINKDIYMGLINNINGLFEI